MRLGEYSEYFWECSEYPCEYSEYPWEYSEYPSLHDYPCSAFHRSAVVSRQLQPTTTGGSAAERLALFRPINLRRGLV